MWFYSFFFCFWLLRCRQCTRRQSTRFDVQETEQTEKLLVMDDAKESKETARFVSVFFFLFPLYTDVVAKSEWTIAYCNDTFSVSSRLPLKKRSARLRPEEAEPCKSFHEGDEVRETIKRRRFVKGLNYDIFTSSILLTDVTKNGLEVTNFLYNCAESLQDCLQGLIYKNCM